MKLLLLISTSLLFLLNPQQQDSNNDPEAAQLMSEVSEKYKSKENIHALFILDIYNPHGEAEIQEGEVWLQGNQFNLKMPGQQMVCDGKNLFMFIEEVEEVQIDYYTPDEESIDPSQLFTMYESDFLYKVKGTVEEDGKTLRVVEMTPLDKEQTYFKVDVTIDPELKTINTVKVYERSGVRYTYNILNQETDIQIEAGFFSPSAEALEEKGYSILDLR